MLCSHNVSIFFFCFREGEATLQIYDFNSAICKSEWERVYWERGTAVDRVEEEKSKIYFAIFVPLINLFYFFCNLCIFIETLDSESAGKENTN